MTRIRNPLNLAQLQAFVAAAHHRSLRAAARELGVTQPAITHTIREIEHALNAELMVRSVRGVELTACGHALLPRAEQLLGDMRRAVEAVEQVKGEMSGRVAVGTMPSIALTALPRAVQKFRATMPSVQLHLAELSVPEAMTQLGNGTLDLAAIHHIPALDREFVQTPLLSTEFVIVMRAGHPLARARSLAELLDAEWIVTVDAEDFPHSVMMAMFTTHGLPLPRRLLRAPSSFSVTLGLVSRSDVIGCFTKPLAEMVAPLGIRIAAIEETLPNYELSILSRRDLLPTPAVTQFIACLKQAAADTLG
ncbi:LysR family transcriptional regulator [Burkholderia gladioli]|uniref:LysR family transcriptional regulator n=1 Tax=Burkholderia gladioli TaxID=28095 RepID=UPI001641714F|nr:LysR substrate-binding domain-containing protein [Burkholderia gladioli]MBU9171330.1 LysR family transcriptional regulator [Burkholderia gladioli]MBU9198255.1 LysR family transcriptional regulator [Burkholderia gladioli]MBU9216098.1 LysR family transcriptional regulator [Burkholderia gladioli]MDC6132158.1 LysR substrate-binding domain-containing protein [Burkholderia gladioli]MDN7725730.1 LysR substrate-binding domain-containing protein [Burkholderia gladioli]